MEAYHHTLAGLVPGNICLATDEPGLAGLHIGSESGFTHAQVRLPAFSGTLTHFMTIKRQTSLGPQGIARSQADGLDAKLLTGLENCMPQGDRLFGVDKQLESHFLAGVTRA